MIASLELPDRETRLREALLDRGLKLPSSLADEGSDFARFLAAPNGIPADQALEWLADAFGLLPLRFTRPTCSTKAEITFRKLARTTDCPTPWLPFGSLGPIILCAHYDPTETDVWHIPDFLYRRILVSKEQYLALQENIMGRLAFSPLHAAEDRGEIPPPEEPHGFLSMLDWALANYPLGAEQMEQLQISRRHFEGRDDWHDTSLRLLPRDFGVAFLAIANGTLAFNPDYAPPQELFPATLLEKHGIYPVFCGSRNVYLLTGDPTSYAFEDEWWSGASDHFRITKILADRDGIHEAIERNRGHSVSSTSFEASELNYSHTGSLVEIDATEIEQINPANIHSTPEQVLHWVLHRSLAQHASDLHIEKYFNTVRFRARIDGQLRVIFSCAEEELQRFVSLVKNYANLGHRRQVAEDGRFSMRIGRRRIDCRVSAIPCSRELQKITIRFLDKKDGVRQLGELNLSERQAGIIGKALGRDQGLILVTGPTGSGKTTSLYAFINSINRDTINIHTVEDPIEYDIEGINQTQTDAANGVDFSEGLRRILRADPDVILIGESRDPETANAAVNAALTGHLVLTTLHANDSLRAISRLISMGVPPYLLADSLALSQAQRLVRRLCNHCKRPVALTAAMRQFFASKHVEIPLGQSCLYEPSGCPACHDTGFSGRIALMEMCVIDSEIADLIAHNAPQRNMRAIGIRNGLLSLYQEGMLHVLAGHTNLEEISCLSYTAEG